MEEFFDKNGKLSRDYLLVSSWTVYYRAFRSVMDWVVLNSSLLFAIYLAVLKYIFDFFLDTRADVFTEQLKIERAKGPSDETAQPTGPSDETAQPTGPSDETALPTGPSDETAQPTGPSDEKESMDKMDDTKKGILPKTASEISETVPPSPFKYESSDEDGIDSSSETEENQHKTISELKDVKKVQLKEFSQSSKESTVIQSIPKTGTFTTEVDSNDNLPDSVEKIDSVPMHKNSVLLSDAGKTEHSLDASVKTSELSTEKKIAVVPCSDTDLKDEESSDNTTGKKGDIHEVSKGSENVQSNSKKGSHKSEDRQSDTGSIDTLKQPGAVTKKSPIHATKFKMCSLAKTSDSKKPEVSKSISAKTERSPKTISRAKQSPKAVSKTTKQSVKLPEESIKDASKTSRTSAKAGEHEKTAIKTKPASRKTEESEKTVSEAKPADGKSGSKSLPKSASKKKS